jgi:hypothetical protein
MQQEDLNMLDVHKKLLKDYEELRNDMPYKLGASERPSVWHHMTTNIILLGIYNELKELNKKQDMR